MSNTNERSNGGSNDEKLIQAAKALIPTSITAFTLSGFTPAESVYQLSAAQVKEMIKKIAESYLDDITGVDLEMSTVPGGDGKKRQWEPIAYIGLPRDSKHVISKSGNREESAIRNRTIVNYSQELKEFLDKFCDKEFRKTIPNREGTLSIRCRLTEFIAIEFDEKGIEYKKLIPADMQKWSRKADFMVKPYFNQPKDNGGEPGNLKYIEVKKFFRNVKYQRNLLPKKSYNI